LLAWPGWVKPPAFAELLPNSASKTNFNDKKGTIPFSFQKIKPQAGTPLRPLIADTTPQTLVAKE